MYKRGSVTKKLVCLFLAVLMCLSTAIVPQAAVSFPMKKTKVKWDLKPNKKIRVKSVYLGVGMKPVDITITNFKKKIKGNKKTVSFDILFDNQCYQPSQSQVHKMIRKMNSEDADFVGGVAFCFVLDYKNGRNLDWEEPDDWEWDPEEEYYDYDEDYDDLVEEARDNPNVKVTRKLKKRYANKTYRDSHGCYVWLTKELYHITIKCPKNYKNLCIGIGGPSYFYDNETDEKWMFGVAPFGHMRDYKKNPKNWHFMRIK